MVRKSIIEQEAENVSALKAEWKRAEAQFQQSFQQVIDLSKRLVEISQAVKTAPKEERRRLLQEKLEFQIDLEGQPYEVGESKRVEIMAHMAYLKAEEERLQKWEDQLKGEEKQYYDAQAKSYEYPQAYLMKCDFLEQEKRAWQELFNDAGLNSDWWKWRGWKTESAWNEHADRRQEELIQQAVNVREQVMKGSWGVPYKEEPTLYKE